ncbi:hypothetical protein GCM10025869_25940 [Homoserinibacter gongjuensis]|uniref:Glycosyl hydrolase family 36 N-terminal domain-containing protein n=1 Tax=Homoserinibacter gongjuensis TaxID=1162968 RepID=A0ABQ6JZ37_9MICO|nr:glycoside hydrolase family 36 N-terminal domain-containing protein [Homoserinibacter gongjuensis]GMA92065.1 hypothetical protein GCM10025869_25940 [Homoserinibacter gongjuensis]
MIEVAADVFFLQTANTSYWFARTEHGHLEHLHYGPLLSPQHSSALQVKRTIELGSSVVYAPGDTAYSLDAVPLEYSGIGQGDYRLSPVEVFTEFGTDTDFTYRSHRILPGTVPAADLPTADGGAGVETLEVTLADEVAGLELVLLYTVFPEVDVITRRTILRNTGDSPAEIVKLASLQLDLPDRGFTVRSFDGGWIHEAHAHDRPLSPGSSRSAARPGRAAIATTRAPCCSRATRMTTTAGSTASTSSTRAITPPPSSGMHTARCACCRVSTRKRSAGSSRPARGSRRPKRCSRSPPRASTASRIGCIASCAST